MYQVYIIKDSGFNPKNLIGEFSDYDKACEKIETELAKDKELKYAIEEMTGAFNEYGEAITRVVKKN